MTPQEKAKELFDKYCYAIRTEENESGYFTNVKHSKECALISVEEILQEIDNTTLSCVQTEYWQEVKEEINKL